MRRKYVWLVFAAFVTLTSLRELGLMQMSTCSKEFTLISQQFGWTKSNHKNFLVNYADKNPLRSDERTPLVEELLQQEIISSGLPDGYALSDFQVALRGPFWVPLRKKGECRYLLKFTRGGHWDQKEYYFINGTLNLTVDGPCSLRDYQAEVARQIARSSRRIVLQPVPSLKNKNSLKDAGRADVKPGAGERHQDDWSGAGQSSRGPWG
jgi:hypothetical protein